MLKRIIELPVAAILFVALGPLMLFIILLIRMESRGPAIFKQRRVGRKGREFTLYKFRSMYIDSDPLAISPRSLGDSRITRVGRFIRRFCLDELPQLVNILKGDMSFVGPRPQLHKELEEFRDTHKHLLEKRLRVRPGLTCLWAIAKDVVKVKPTADMLESDCRYVDNAGFLQDFKIMFQTFTYLVARR